MSTKLYKKGIRSLMTGQVDLLNDDIKVALFRNTYTPSDTDENFASLTGEASGVGYTAGGKSLSGKTLTENTLGVRFGASDITWSATALNFDKAVVYSATTGKVIAHMTFPTVVNTDVQDVTLKFTNGLFEIRF